MDFVLQAVALLDAARDELVQLQQRVADLEVSFVLSIAILSATFFIIL
jgi:hypothetical protein